MIVCADNVQVLSASVQRCFEREDPWPVRELVARCMKAGADMIDINPGPMGKKGRRHMAFLVRTIQDIIDLPVMIDTADPKLMEAGLRANRATAVVNGISLEPEKFEGMLPLIKDTETDVVGYLLTREGQVPPDADTRFGIAVELVEALQSNGVDPGRLIIDPILTPLTWENGPLRAREALSTIRMLPDVLGFPVRTMAGLSNLTSGCPDPEKRLHVECMFIPMLAACGLTILLMNALHAPAVQMVRSCRLITRPGVFSWEQVPPAI